MGLSSGVWHPRGLWSFSDGSMEELGPDPVAPTMDTDRLLAKVRELALQGQADWLFALLSPGVPSPAPSPAPPLEIVSHRARRRARPPSRLSPSPSSASYCPPPPHPLHSSPAWVAPRASPAGKRGSAARSRHAPPRRSLSPSLRAASRPSPRCPRSRSPDRWSPPLPLPLPRVWHEAGLEPERSLAWLRAVRYLLPPPRPAGGGVAGE